MFIRIHLDGIVDRNVREAVGEVCGLVERILRRRKKHDVIHGREHTAACVVQIAIFVLPEGNQLRTVLHVERDAVFLRHKIAGTDLLAVVVDGNPFVAVVNDKIELRVYHLPAAGKAGNIDDLGFLHEVRVIIGE